MIPSSLPGNKCDSYEKIVDLPTALEFAQTKETPLMEVSAKDGTNIEPFFQMLLELLIQPRFSEEAQSELHDLKFPVIYDPKNGNCCTIL